MNGEDVHSRSIEIPARAGNLVGTYLPVEYPKI